MPANRKRGHPNWTINFQELLVRLRGDGSQEESKDALLPLAAGFQMLIRRVLMVSGKPLGGREQHLANGVGGKPSRSPDRAA